MCRESGKSELWWKKTSEPSRAGLNVLCDLRSFHFSELQIFHW